MSLRLILRRQFAVLTLTSGCAILEAILLARLSRSLASHGSEVSALRVAARFPGIRAQWNSGSDAGSGYAAHRHRDLPTTNSG